MATSKKTEVFTRDILELKAALEEGREKFTRVFQQNSQRLSNCSCGDSYLEGALKEVCYKAIDKFILEKQD